MIDIDLYVAFFTGDSSPRKENRLLKKNALQTMEKGMRYSGRREKNQLVNEQKSFFLLC